MTDNATTTQPDPQQPMEPTLQFFVLCDNVAQEGPKPVFVGVFDQIRRPGPIPQFIIAIRWTNGLGHHRLNLRILDPDLKELTTFDGKFELRHRAANATVFFNVVNFVFPVPGVYWFEIKLNDASSTSIPLPVHGGA